MNFLTASHRLARIFGIEVRIAFTMYLGMLMVYSFSGNLPFPYVLLPVLGFPFFVLLHEFGHSLTAIAFGVPVRRITLYILGGAAELGGLVPGPKAEIVIAAAGPAVSTTLCGLFFALSAAFSGGVLGWIFIVCAYANLSLALFNLLPIFPMDGGRIALASAIMVKGEEKGVRLVKPLSMIGAALLAAFGIWRLTVGDMGGIFIVLIAAMTYFKGNQELMARQYAAMYSSGGDRWMNDGAYYRSDGKSIYGEEEKKPGFFERWSQERKAKREAREQEEMSELNAQVDDLLAKVKRDGLGSLTPQERNILNNASKKYRHED